jgi:hypothetical protein
MELDKAALADLIRCRQMAEEAVEDMPEGPRKERAFEILFRSLLEGRTGEPGVAQNRKLTKQKPAKARAKEQVARRARAGPLTHVRQLVESGYFDEPRRLPEIVEHLRVKGHLYDQSPVSAALLRLTRGQELRRIPEKDEKGRKLYIYQKALR